MCIRLSLAVFVLALCLASGCKQSGLPTLLELTNMTNSYNAAIESGVRGQSFPGQFNRLFPGARNVISYYTGVVGPSTWTSSIGLHDRYVFRMHLSVQFDEPRTNILSYGAPTFYLYELPKITVKPNENPYITINQIANFSADSWALLLKAKGDFRVLGIALQTNNPVEGFEPNWRAF